MVEVPCPALVTVSNELGEPRYPTTARKLAARRMQATTVSLEELALPAEDLQPRVRLTRLSVPTIQGSCEFISGDTPAAAADGLVKRLYDDSILQ